MFVYLFIIYVLLCSSAKINSKEISKTISCLRNSKCQQNCLKIKNTVSIKMNYSDKDAPFPFPYSYSFTNYTPCPPNTIIFIYIISECKQHIERDAVRLTWGENIYSNITIKFIIGIGNDDCAINYQYENSKYGDMLQINIYESFANETLFGLYTMKYLTQLCPYSYYYCKFDIDTYVNISKLYYMLASRKYKENSFWGAEIIKWKRVNDDRNYKYSSPSDIAKYYNCLFPKNGIAVYSGFATILTYNIPALLFNESLKYLKLIRIDDQYISWLLHKLKIKIKPISSYAILPNKCTIYKNVLVIHRIRSYDLIAYYRYLKMN